ncbi:hypothetical protein [Marinigracilibium pacificum]|uniref:Outer membrane protein with beta-barrel domain n=1 Tax=Marinigracilibium pacificum TaxID=2729599 RepID=A0A848IZ71_9BACT|nr:hypothetical protein [Marinigracilibium pacificum]NMM47514.1 hypothetical protein [Marinigracilibium pacificum]
MILNLKTGLCLVLFFVLYNMSGQDQSFSKHSIKIGSGIGYSEGMQTNGLGLIYSLGYQKEMLNGRLRLNPNFSFGHYSTRISLDSKDQFFNSINIDTKIFYDIIRIRSFSVVAGLGALVNNSRGIIGNRGEIPNEYSEYISDFHVGGFFGAGFRVNPAGDRVAYNLYPLYINRGTNGFFETHLKFELDIKF